MLGVAGEARAGAGGRKPSTELLPCPGPLGEDGVCASVTLPVPCLPSAVLPPLGDAAPWPSADGHRVQKVTVPNPSVVPAHPAGT